MNEDILKMSDRAEKRCTERFRQIDQTAQENTRRVLESFRSHRVSEACFSGTTGYGYDDLGRETLDKIYAELLGTESALVRIGFVNGTHALTTALFALAKPGETILSLTGLPYDTLQEAIGIRGNDFGSLKFYGIEYQQVELDINGGPNYQGITEACKNPNVTAVLIQRSRGYASRKALTVDEIGQMIRTVREVRPDIHVMVDNCYGEFTDIREPGHVGADLVAGSLIKNPGGGVAPTGGYVAGREELVARAAVRLTTPGIGGECGASLGNNRLLFQGLFVAPHVVAQSLKTSVFCAAMMEELGIDSFPGVDEPRSDIIQTVRLGSEDRMKRFCRGIQKGAPVDSYVTPEPWAMPGYEDPNIYVQGGITYESGKLGILYAVEELLKD